MKCYYHEDRDAVAQCNVCGKGLCKECADMSNPPICRDCCSEIEVNVKDEAKKLIIRSILLFILGGIFGVVLIISTKSPDTGFMSAFFNALISLVVMGWIFAGFPCAWTRLSKIFSKFTAILIIPILGWLLIFMIKMLLSCYVAFVALPIDLIRAGKTLKEND